MVFIMPNWARCRKTIGLLSFLLMPGILWANGFAARVRYLNVQKNDLSYVLNARLDYHLSPIANEAIQKGVPLSWKLLIKIQQHGLLWNKTLFHAEIPFIIQYHALLNQYSVKNSNSDEGEMFTSLKAAIKFMGTIHALKLLKTALLQADKSYFVSVKIQFDREFLPIPLRPESYFDSGWSLSSDWKIWPIQK